MQISKCFLTVCLAVSVFPVCASDNDAQAKAREALEKKLNDLKGQAPQTVTPQAAPAPKAPAKAPAPTPAAAPAPTPVAQPVAAQAPADDASIAKAREAMQKKLNEMQGAPPAAAPAAAAAPVATQPPPPKKQPKAQPTQAPPATVPAAVAAPVAVVPPPQSTTFSPVPAADPQAIAKARDAMREKMQSLEAQPSGTPTAPAITPAPAALPPPAPAVAVTPVEPPTTPGINGPPEADAASINKARDSVRTAMAAMPPEASSTAKPGALNFPALQGPPLGISAEKEGHLRALLQQYKMDLISPEQYQAARAKILAGP